MTTKLEELKAAVVAAWEAGCIADAAGADAAEYADVDAAIVDATVAYIDELEKTQEENSND
jgi:hypothetical protein